MLAVVIWLNGVLGSGISESARPSPRVVVYNSRCSVGINCLPAAALATHSCPNILVMSENGGQSWMVKNTIFVAGEIRRIS